MASMVYNLSSVLLHLVEKRLMIFLFPKYKKMLKYFVMTWLVLEPEICLMKTHPLEFCLPVKLKVRRKPAYSHLISL